MPYENMKFAFATSLAVGFCLAVNAADPASPTNAASVLKSDVDKLSYSFGLNMGSNIKQNDIDVNLDMILRGLQDGVGGKAALMTQAEIAQIQDTFRKQLRTKQEAKLVQVKQKNLAAGQAFLAAKEMEEGVKKTGSGLLYKVIKPGSGPKPAPTDRVAVHYRGTFLDGAEFDSSAKRGPEPVVMGVSQVIKGWGEALTNMNVGSKWEIYVPSGLAYGEQGRPNIEPNSALIFDVELVEIRQPEQPPQPITSDIIKVPSKAELDAGAKIEIIKQEDLAKLTNKNNTAKPAGSPTPAQKPANAPR